MICVFVTCWATIFYDIIKNAKTPLVIWPRSGGAQQLYKMGQKNVKEWEEVLAISSKECVGDISYFTQNIDIFIILI